MTDPIAAKAEALWAKRPELRPLGLKYNHLGWWMYQYSVMDDFAHMLIEAECVRWLLKQRLPSEPNINADLVLWEGVTYDGVQLATVGLAEGVRTYDAYFGDDVHAPTLTEALLLAVEQVHGGKQ